MDSTKYIGMDVHKETVSIAVMNSAGKLVVESIIETKAATILQFIQGLRGNLQVTWEEGTWATWLYDLLKPHVTKIVVCDPRRNALLKEGNNFVTLDARKLAELLRAVLLRPVYDGENGLRTLKELSRSYLTMARCVDGRTFARNAPAPVESLEPIHDAREIFADRGWMQPKQFWLPAQGEVFFA